MVVFDGVQTSIPRKRPSLILALLCLCAPACSETGESVLATASNSELLADSCTRIEFELVAELSSTPEQPFDHPNLMASDGNGFFISPRSAQHQLLHYDKRGAFIRRFDDQGEGPNAIRAIRGIIPQDSLVRVVDPGNARLVTLDASLDVVETVPFAGRVVYGATDSWRNRDIVLASYGFGGFRRSVDHLIHVVDPAGNIKHSVKPFQHESSVGNFVAIATAPDSTVWVAGTFDHRIEQWDPVSGELLREMAVIPDWFQPLRPDPEPGTVEDRPGGTRRGPSASVRGIAVGPNGLLWVVSQVPDPNLVMPERGEPMPTPQEAIDAVIEVLDPESGEVRARCRLNGFVQSFLGDRMIPVYRESRRGEPHMSIYRPILTLPE